MFLLIILKNKNIFEFLKLLRKDTKLVKYNATLIDIIIYSLHTYQ
jgi:hypothetical protein